MYSINLELQTFDMFITESENHLNMIHEHYDRLSKGYLVESAEYQLIQESEQSTFGATFKKIIDAIMKWFNDIINNIKKKMIERQKRKTMERIYEYRPGSDNIITMTHDKFDISKLKADSLHDSMVKFIEKVSHVLFSNTTFYNFKDTMVKISNDTMDDMYMNTLGIKYNPHTDMQDYDMKKIFIDPDNKITKQYTLVDIKEIRFKLLDLATPIIKANDKIQSEANTFLDKLKNLGERSKKDLHMHLKMAVSHVNRILREALRIAKAVNDSYLQIDSIVSNIEEAIVVGKSKQESFLPPVDASFEALLEQINPTRIKLLDLN